MASDLLLPTAPARVRVLVLPAGRIKRTTFRQFTETFRSHSSIRLGDVSPDSRPGRTMFSPLAFPDGMLLYGITTALPTPSQVALTPFEQFREPLIVVGIADGYEYRWESDGDADARDSGHEFLPDAIERLRDKHEKALVHRLFLLNAPSGNKSPKLPADVMPIPPQSQWKTTTIKTTMCDLSSIFLAELTTFARSIQALPSIPSPAAPNSETGDDLRRSKPAPAEAEQRHVSGGSSSRPQSPLSGAGSNHYRMSMPAHLPSSSNPSPSPQSRPTSPPTSSHGAPATSFDDMPGASNASIARSNSVAQRSSAAGGTNRSSSQDRVSVHGFGPGGVLERARNKGISRVGIIVANLYLCAGLWGDALRELSEHATSARNLSDHLWHAKAMENILVCMILLAWRGIDFQIPQVCLPMIDKTSSASRSPQHTPTSSIAEVNGTGSPRSSTQVANVQKLSTLLPDLVYTILAVYSRAANFSGESLPPQSHCEGVIRLSRFLAATNLAGGQLTNDALQNVVTGTNMGPKSDVSISRLASGPTKNEIAGILLRALPTGPEGQGIPVVDASIIFTGIASVLSALGLTRKRAIVLKELVSTLIPAIVQARKLGAAEMGVHPAAGLSSLAGSDESGAAGSSAGIIDFLDTLGDIYGIQRSAASRREAAETGYRLSVESAPDDASQDFRTSQFFEQMSLLQGFGNRYLKLDILRMCITFCEALPDFAGLLHFSAALLRTAGPGIAPRHDSLEVFVSLAKEEQIRHASTISKTVSTARKLGLQDVEAEYWDDFLVRGLNIAEVPAHKSLTKHQHVTLDAAKGPEKKRSPFIHDPFMHTSEEQTQELILVAGDEYEFLVTLQNPFEFEVELESLALEAEGVAFEAVVREQVLGPYRTQRFHVTGSARTPGKLTIRSCRIKVRGCREQSFSIFTEPWHPRPNPKLKGIGLDAAKHSHARPISSISTASDTAEPPVRAAPLAAEVSFIVLPPQPIVALSRVSLSQTSVMLLEGEKKTIQIEIENTSSSTPTDFLNVAFQDTVTTALRNATTNKELPRAELHELELQLATNAPLKLFTEKANTITRIAPQEKATFEIEILGRPGLIEGTVQFDYGNINQDIVPGHFFTRQVTVPIHFTVNASIQLQRFDIAAYNQQISWPPQGPLSSASSDSSAKLEKCMLLIDLRNAWPNPLTINVSALQTSPSPEDTQTPDHWSSSFTTTTIIQPGHTSRLILLIPRIYIPNPYAPIPSLNPATQRQFIVSSARHSPDAERATREAFWYREALLSRLRGTWVEESTGREGTFDLRGIRLGGRMVEALKLDDISISISISTNSSSGDPASSDKDSGKSSLQKTVPTETPLTLSTTLTNRSPSPIHPLLRLLPSLSSLPSPHSHDISKKLLFSGVTQRPLPILGPGESITTTVGVCVLASGSYEVGACVEEVQVLGGDGENQEGKDDFLGERLLGERRRRVWFAREGCVFVAVRGEEEEDEEEGAA